MQPNKKNEDQSVSAKPVLGQVIACVVALGIMGFGGWSLLGQKAPYHPDSYESQVTRGVSDLNGLNESN